MCGIGGIIAPFSSQRWKAKVMDKLLLAAQKRGTDATGICFVDPKRGMVIVKDGKRAWDFVRENPQYKEERANFPAIVLGHCRAATKRGSTGSEDNKNNHPFFAKEARIAMIHNGLIANDDNWRETVGQDGGLRNKPESVVDSEVMVCAVETFFLEQEEGKRTMKDAIDDAAYTISGSYTLALLKEDEPNRVYFVRHDNPLSFAWIPSEKAIVFGSTEEIIKEALEEYKEHLGYFMESIETPAIINDANEDTLVIIDILPPESKVPFKVVQHNLDVAKSDVRARHYIHENIPEKMVD